MERKAFPTADVCRILSINAPTKGDTYVSINFTLDEMSALETAGALDLEDCQNDSPSIGAFLEFFRANSYNDLTFIDYIIFPPRSDARVSVEGFECKCSPGWPQTLLRDTFRKADEFEIRNGRCRAWYD